MDVFAAYDQNASGVLTAQQMTDGINGKTQQTGVTAALSGGVLRLSAADGRDIAIGQTVAGAAAGGISAGTGGSSTVERRDVPRRYGRARSPTRRPTAPMRPPSTVAGHAVRLGEHQHRAVMAPILGFATANATITKDTQTLASQNVRTVAAPTRPCSVSTRR